MDKKNIEAIYPLTPAQQTLMFHRLQAGRLDQGFLQLVCTLKGSLRISDLENAWIRVMERHSALRTSIHGEDLDQHLQIVHRRLPLPWVQEDWSEAAKLELPHRLKEFLRTDQERGFDLSKAPIMRLALLKLNEKSYRLVWSFHHILLDGWSGAIAIKEVFDQYQALGRGEELGLPPARPYRDYVNWLNRQDAAKAEVFWRKALEGFSECSLLPTARETSHTNGSPRRTCYRQISLGAGTAAALQNLAQTHQMTFYTMLQGAWALLLNHYSGKRDIVFGSTVSGRPPTLDGADEMVGLFMNTVPMRARFSDDQLLLPWLGELQRLQFSMTSHETTPLTQILDWCEVPFSSRLFQTLLVFENYPWKEMLGEGDGSLEICELESGVTSDYPLAVLVKPDSEWTVQFIYDGQQFETETIDRMLRDFRTILEGFSVDARQRLSEFLPPHEAGISPLGEDESGKGHPIESSQLDSDEPGKLDRCRPHLPPRNPWELKLTLLWEQVFGIHPIGVSDNFFELGGRSLQAVRLFSRIKETMGIQLPLPVLFERPTVELLAQRLDGGPELSPWTSLVAINTSGTKPPLFCVHSGGGPVFYYHDLSLLLGTDQPVYGLQPVGMSGQRAPLTRIEDMAAFYLRELQTVQPKGPYYLMGRCVGAAICFEMAQQLLKQDEQLGALIILDTGIKLPDSADSDSAARPMSRSVRRYGRRLLYYVRQGDFGFLWQWLRGRLARVRSRIAAKKLSGAAETQEDILKSIELILFVAWNSYKPKGYPGRLTLIRSSQYHSQRNKDDHLANWSVLAKQGVDCLVVSGHHQTIFNEPEVRNLAQVLAGCLDTAQGGDATTGANPAPP